MTNRLPISPARYSKVKQPVSVCLAGVLEVGDFPYLVPHCLLPHLCCPTLFLFRE